MFEDFQDTDNAATEGKENTEDAIAVDVEGKEADVREEPDEGNKI